MLKQITVYEFCELTNEIQKEVIQKFNFSDPCLQMIQQESLQNAVNSEKAYLESIGFSDINISWRLAYSQGDHVTIYARMYQDELLGFFSGESLIEDYDDLRQVDYIELEVNNYRQISWDCMPESLYNDEGELSVNIQHFKHVLKEFLKDSAESLYRALQDEDDYVTSDAFVSEYIEGNEMLFTESGIQV